MKKLLCTALALITGSMMLFTGCGSNNAYDYDLSEYITVGEYEGLTYSEPDDIKISQSEIDEAVEEDLEAAQYLKDVEDDTVHDGDTVVIDYVGTIDGEEFDGGSADDYSLVIGSDSFIDGFEDGLIGKKVGKTVSLDLTFPDDYSSEDLAGKDVTFEVTIDASQEYVTPTEKYYVKNSTDYESVKKYEEAVEQELYEAEEEEQENEILDALWTKLKENSEVIKYPEKEVDAYIEKTKKTIEDYADENSMEYADVLESYYSMTEEEFDEEIQTAAESNCMEQMIVYSIARDQDIEVTSEEYGDFITAQLESTGYTAEEFEEYTGSTYEEYVGGEDYIYFYLYYQKVMEYVKSKAVAK